MDDLAQWAMLTDRYPIARSPFDLFAFVRGPEEVSVLISRGSLPWWSDPELRLSALRPLSSALTALDHRLFGPSPLVHHLHSLAWWAAMIAAAAWVLRDLLPRRWAIVALLLFALDEGHSFPLAWLANRNALVSATFGFVAIGAHVRWRRDASRHWLLVEVAALALSLAGGETGLCAFLLLVAFEAWGRVDLRAHRLKALLPAMIVVLIHAVAHRMGGHGVSGSGIYVDPLRDPITWLELAAVRWPTLAADMLLVVPSGRVGLNPEQLIWLAPAGILGFGLMGLGVLRLRAHPQGRTLRWLFLGSVFAIAPVASAFVSARLLLIPTLAAHAVIAAIVVTGIESYRERHPGRAGWLHRIGAAVLVVGHGGLAPWWAFREARSISAYDRDAATVAARMNVPVTAREQLVLLTASDPWTLLYPPHTRALQGHPMPAAWWVLSMAPHRHQLTRTDDHTFELAVQGGAMLDTPLERMFRRSPMRPGDRVQVPGLTVEVAETNPAGHPTRVRYHFDRRLDDPTLRILLASPRGIIPYPLGPPNTSVPIPPAATPATVRHSTSPSGTAAASRSKSTE